MKKSQKKAIREACDQASKRIPEFRRVLATTDLSESSNRAIAYAYSMLRPGSLVRIVHVEKPFEFANPIYAHHAIAAQRLVEERSRQIEQCQTLLLALIPLQAESHGILTEVQVLHEDKPASAICRAAEQFGADLICIGSHGRSGFSKAILGSVAQAVVIVSSIPVLVIPVRE
jgi:nucleotide-binding universal stress UspA family protein